MTRELLAVHSEALTPKRSAAAAEITATADPALLAEARREAEQDCLRSQS